MTISKQQATSKSPTMAELLARQKPTFLSLKKGEIIKGKISKLTPHEVLVDINAKTEAVVLEKDRRLLRNLLSSLKIGDEVTVSVLNPESDQGNPVVSLRKFLSDASWKKLAEYQKEQKQLNVTINEVTRGGFLVSTPEGTIGFLPNSHTDHGLVDEAQNPQVLIGRRIKAYVLELQRLANKIIFSQKLILGSEDFNKAITLLKVGQKVEGVVTSIASFGVFVSIAVEDKNLDGLVHVSEIAWEKVSDIPKMFEIGQTIEAVIIGFDKEAKRVDLSIKRLQVNPFDEVIKNFSVDQAVEGTILKITSTGISVELSVPTTDVSLKEGESRAVTGFIRKEKIPPNVTYKEGNTIKATISQIDAKKQRLILTPVLSEKPIGYR